MLKARLSNICLHHFNKAIHIAYETSILFQIYQSSLIFQLYYFIIFTNSENLFHSVPCLKRKTFLFIFWTQPLCSIVLYVLHMFPIISQCSLQIENQYFSKQPAYCKLLENILHSLHQMLLRVLNVTVKLTVEVQNCLLL